MHTSKRTALVVLSLLAGGAACSSSPGTSEPPEATARQSAASSGLTRKLYVLNQSGDSRVGDFFSCILGNNSNFNTLANTYTYGESLDWGGQVQRNDDPCTGGVGSQGFYQCAVNAGHFNVQSWDVVLVIYPNSHGYGGQNGTANVKNPVTGGTVTINSAYIATSPNWIYQTIYGMHEVFEAATDGVSGDCCDGETSTGGPFPWCGQCGPFNGGNGVCGKYAPGGSVGSLGIATIKCPTGTFYYQEVSPQNHEFDGTCDALHLNGGSSDPCAGVPSADNGVYCGKSNQNGFGGGSSNVLYTCTNGATTSTQTCANGCFIAAPGQADGCNTSPTSTDPCAGVSSANNGIYCGASHENGFAGAAVNTLYDCQNGKTASTQTCSSGCYVAPPGSPDTCNGDPCANVSSANDGVYCGTSNQSGFAGGSADELYTCTGGKTAATQVCPDGCSIAAPGQPDSCNNPPASDAGTGGARPGDDAGTAAGDDGGPAAGGDASGSAGDDGGANGDAPTGHPGSQGGCTVSRGPVDGSAGAWALAAFGVFALRRRRRVADRGA